MLARTSCLDRWPGELNEVDLLIQRNSKPKLVYYYQSTACTGSTSATQKEKPAKFKNLPVQSNLARKGGAPQVIICHSR